MQGKGVMDTYWLTCKEGGVHRTIEMETPSYFQVSDNFKDNYKYLINYFIA